MYTESVRTENLDRQANNNDRPVSYMTIPTQYPLTSATEKPQSVLINKSSTAAEHPQQGLLQEISLVTVVSAFKALAGLVQSIAPVRKIRQLSVRRSICLVRRLEFCSRLLSLESQLSLNFIASRASESWTSHSIT